MWLFLSVLLMVAGQEAKSTKPFQDSNRSDGRDLISLLSEAIAETESEEKSLLVFSKLQLCQSDLRELNLECAVSQYLPASEVEKLCVKLKKSQDEVSKLRAEVLRLGKTLSVKGSKELFSLIDEYIDVYRTLISNCNSELGDCDEKGYRTMLQSNIELKELLKRP